MPEVQYPEKGNTTMAPARSAFAVVPNDATELANYPKALYIGGAGNLTVRLADDTADVVFTGVLAGTVLAIRAKLVKTATTATNIVALL